MATRGILVISCGETDAYLPHLLASVTKHSALPILIHRNPSLVGRATRAEKLRMVSLSPWDQTLVVDCDTIFCADPEPIFELLELQGVWMCIDVGPRTVTEMLAHEFFQKYTSPEAKDLLARVARVHPHYPHFNSGVVLFDRRAAVLEFFTAWNDAWHSLPPGQDQVALMITMCKLGVRPGSLSPRWNWQHSHKRDEKDLAVFRGEIRILHLLGMEKPELYRRAHAYGYTPFTM